MEKETQNLLIVVGLAIVIIYIARPKNNLFDSKKSGSKYDPPKQVSKDITDRKRDGQIIIEAMRNALNSKEKQTEIDKLNKMFLQEYGMKVYFSDNGKLQVKDSKGKLITKES